MHPLLETIHIDKLQSATEMKDAIEQQGLLVKYDSDVEKLIVKYPERLRHSTSDAIRKSRGIIIDTETRAIVCPSLDGAVSFDEFARRVPWSDVVIERCHDGTMYNVYFDPRSDSWHLATKFHLHPEKNYYRSKKSFFELFNDAIPFDQLCSVLDKECSYVFLLCHPENRNVTQYNEAKLYHLETCHVKTCERIFTRIEIDGTQVPPCDILQYCGRAIQQGHRVIPSYEGINEYVDTMHWSNAGLMLYSKDRQYRCHILNPRFESVRNFLAGHTSFEFLCMKKIKGEVSDEEWSRVLNYYPELDESMRKTIRAYNTFVGTIYSMYVRMRVKHEQLDVPKEWKMLLYSIHTYYLNTRHGVPVNDAHVCPSSRFTITVEYVAEKVLSYDTRLIYSWIKNYL
jgi:hypothetical protein